MSPTLFNRRIRSLRPAAVLVLASFFLSLVPRVQPSAAMAPSPQSPAAPFVRVLNLPVNDIIYEKQSKKILVSVPSRVGSAGNSVNEIEPVTGALGAATFVGSEPNKLAVSDDGQTVYVGIDGAASVRRVNMTTHTAGTQFRLGSDSSGAAFTAGDLAVVPGNSNAVA